MARRFLTSLWVSAALTVCAFADVKMTADIKDGDKIAGMRRVSVNVDSKHLITSVEFYVNGDLRNTDDSAPYELDLDTISEAEGGLTLKIAAFNNEGEKAEQTFKLTIDNGLSRGAEAFVGDAKSSLTAGKLDDAILSGRLALKADSNSTNARLVLAQSYYRKNVYDEAQKYCEDILSKNAKNTPALDLLSAVHLKKVFVNAGRARTRADQVEMMRASLLAAAKNRAKVWEIKLDEFGTVSETNLIAFCDLALRAGRYSLVIDKLVPVYKRDYRNVEVANRLAYAYMRNARMDLAASTMADHAKRATPDAFGNILLALLSEYQGSGSAAQGYESAAVQMSASAPTVLGGRSFLALVRKRAADLAKFSKSYSTSQPQSPVANYYRCISLADSKDFNGSQDAFETAILAEPASYDLWLQRANDSITSSLIPGIAKTDQSFSQDLAEVFLDAALAARPDCFEALTSRSILSVYRGANDEGYRFAKAAVAAGPGYGAAHYALAMTASLQNKKALERVTGFQLAAKKAHDEQNYDQEKSYTASASKAQDDARRYALESETAMKMAGKLDPTNLGGRAIPDALGAWNHINRYGRTPWLEFGR